MSKSEIYFSVLETERLILREIRMADAAALFVMRTNPEVLTFLDRPPAVNLEEVVTFIENVRQNIAQNGGAYWVITLKEPDILIGTICYWNMSPEENKGEIGYALLPDYQGQGFMQESMEPVIRFGFETMQLKTIEAWPKQANVKSVKILEKFKFIPSPDPEGEYLIYRLQQPST